MKVSKKDEHLFTEYEEIDLENMAPSTPFENPPHILKTEKNEGFTNAQEKIVNNDRTNPYVELRNNEDHDDNRLNNQGVELVNQ